MARFIIVRDTACLFVCVCGVCVCMCVCVYVCVCVIMCFHRLAPCSNKD